MSGLNYGDNMVIREFGKKGKPDTYRTFVKDPNGTFQGNDGVAWSEVNEPNQPNKSGGKNEMDS